MAGVAERIFDLIRPTVEGCGVSLWDVRFVKEGASYYLRVFIDKPEGIDIDDCTNVSHAIDPVIDEADPIDKSYYLEVCSPGLERQLVRPEHFARFIGSPVKLKLYRAVGGSKELSGVLVRYDGGVEIETPSEHIYIDKKDITAVRLDDMNF
jgi:ribosome maturation factor RimP